MKRLYRAAFFILLFSLFMCAPVFGNDQLINIQDIIIQWSDIEQRLAQTRFLSGGAESDLEKTRFINDAAAFRQSIQSYLDSDMYRIYRSAPLSSKMPLAFWLSPPNEIPEIQTAADLSLAFDEAVSDGDWEKAVLISTDISGNLIRSLMKDNQAERFAGGAYLRLLVVFIVFIALTALLIWFLYKALVRSVRREAEGAVFTRAVILAQEDLRAGLSRELHDTIAQDLRYLSLEMDKIGRTAEKTAREELCAQAASMQSALIRKVRDICDFLVPPDFRFQGLPDALRRLCFDFGKRTGIDCRIDIAENTNVDFLNEEKQLQIFRIVQEALANVEKHAEAKEAIVILRGDTDGTIAAGVSDDGKGFDPSPDARSYGGHLGIRGMRERAALLGGALEIKSEPGEGTMVRLHIQGARNERAVD